MVKKQPTTSSSPSTGVRKEDFGSIVDYLEAKYARGVVPEEKKKKKPPKKNKKQSQDDNNKEDAAANVDDNDNQDNKDDGNGNDEDDSSNEDDDRSIYSKNSFLDDTELLTNVAEQAMASSRGMTKIEIEASNKKKKNAINQKNNKDDNDNDNNDLLDYDDDDAFFINIGSLEMEDGYDANDVSKIDFDALDKPNVKYVYFISF